MEINFRSGVPVYLQLVAQVKGAVAAGLIRDGEQLPSIRELAEQLRVNRNTIARAYQELEAEGVVETQQGRGVFISGSAAPFTKRVRDEVLGAAIDGAIVQAYHFGVEDDAFVQMVRARLGAFHKQRTTAEKKAGTK